MQKARAEMKQRAQKRDHTTRSFDELDVARRDAPRTPPRVVLPVDHVRELQYYFKFIGSCFSRQLGWWVILGLVPSLATTRAHEDSDELVRS